jgi:hypothetical protein
MSVSGLCEICEQREVVDGCDRCGRLVCSRHFESGPGLCTDCYAQVHGGESTEEERERGKRDRPDGVEEYRF